MEFGCTVCSPVAVAVSRWQLWQQSHMMSLQEIEDKVWVELQIPIPGFSQFMSTEISEFSSQHLLNGNNNSDLLCGVFLYEK